MEKGDLIIVAVAIFALFFLSQPSFEGQFTIFPGTTVGGLSRIFTGTGK